MKEPGKEVDRSSSPTPTKASFGSTDDRWNVSKNSKVELKIQLLRERLPEKYVRDNPERWYGINTLNLRTVAFETYFCCFPLALENISPWSPVPFFQMSFSNSLIIHTVISQSECPILVSWMYPDTQWKSRSRLLRLVQKLMKTLIKTLEF